MCMLFISEPVLEFSDTEYHVTESDGYARATIIRSGTYSLRKRAYSNILKISPPKTESFQIKIDIFHICAQNIDCGYLLELPCQARQF